MWRKLGVSFPGGSGVAQTGWEVPLTRDGVPSTGRNSSGFLRDVGETLRLTHPVRTGQALQAER